MLNYEHKCWFSEACPKGAILASKIDQLWFSNPHFRILRVKYSLMQKVSSLCDDLFSITKIKALCITIKGFLWAISDPRIKHSKTGWQEFHISVKRSIFGKILKNFQIFVLQTYFWPWMTVLTTNTHSQQVIGLL